MTKGKPDQRKGPAAAIVLVPVFAVYLLISVGWLIDTFDIKIHQIASFLQGFVGFAGAIFAIVFAWRIDVRSSQKSDEQINELKLKIEQLQSQIVAISVNLITTAAQQQSANCQSGNAADTSIAVQRKEE